MLQAGDFKIYNASAGAGKTYTLVKEFLSLLLTHESDYHFEHILAITFTNKAAGEMKERIIETLEEIAKSTNPKEDRYIMELATELNMKPEIIKTKAHHILIAILHNYSKFSISTIDKFNLRLMKSFAQDLGLSMNFDVEMNTNEIISESVDLLYSKIGEDEKLTQTMIKIALDNMDDNKSWDIRKSLSADTNDISNDRHLQDLEKLKNISLDEFVRYRNVIYRDVKILKEGLILIGNEFHDLLSNNGISVNELPGKSRGIAAFFIKLKNYDGSGLILPTDANSKDMLDGGYLSKVKDATAETIFPQLKDLFDKAASINDHLLLLSSIQKNISSISLINEVEKSLDAIKKESNVLLINEFNTIISKNLQEQPANFIYERIGSRYNHYFIDEFQDTSTLQWNNLDPLVENARAQSDTIMLVGDAKQSIYRWRGGNPAQMIDLIDRKGEENIKVEELEKNWRSHEKIIQFNNELYSFIAPQLNLPSFQYLYEIGNKQLTNHQKDGFVKINFIEQEGRSKDLYKEQNLELVLKTIHECLENGFALSDIAILVRSNAQGILLAKHLTENNLVVISNEALLLKNSFEIQLIEYLFKITSNPMDEQAKIRFLMVAYELNLFTTDDLTITVENALKGGLTKFIELAKSIGIELSFILDQNLSLYDFTEKTIRSLNLQDRSPAYILNFLDVILEYSSKNESDLNSFLEFWETKKDKASIKTPKGVDAIQIMTIHKSKGLEFPVVILPFLDWQKKNSKIWIPLQKNEENPFETFYVGINSELKSIKNEEIKTKINEEESLVQLDEINTLYVATTRAKEQLYMMALKPKEKSTSSSIANYLQEFVWQQGFSDDEVILKGSQNRVSQPKIKENASAELKIYSSDWNTRLVINTNSEKAQEKLKFTEFGNTVHNILQQIITADNLPKIIESEKQRGTLSYENTDHLQKTLQNLLQDPKLVPYFADGLTVLNERDFIDEHGQIFRADRVVIDSDNNCSIIDYKTGQPDLEQHFQVNRYAEFFEKLGYHIQSKMLIYIDDQKQKINVVEIN
ncbi:ATP-dependent exoDNAse (exonuclease V) beta subunit (contains helicase and exonuclease domains) [Chishuiella changwenlii]|uniref:DNA 3'-5' helicase n=1 Tax=Chishuiella changwenlii TaxID=1434701 RepID=A0A1M6VXC3_9FLAO|nr:UvrD-helicase domain-containing protein [Chishuiella changwenlii]GGE89711.1 ATP-dependent helicase [Chishuiella changwenlii]SHK85956.1 ATP-dependent exoDNAse (exonuclease V) beta subunit (contains helicase and exonuclease domains) [Chishuiella changwenlii]